MASLRNLLLHQGYSILSTTAGLLLHPPLTIRRLMQQDYWLASTTLLGLFLGYYCLRVLAWLLWTGSDWLIAGQLMLFVILLNWLWFWSSSNLLYRVAQLFGPLSLSSSRFRQLWIFSLWPTFLLVGWQDLSGGLTIIIPQLPWLSSLLQYTPAIWPWLATVGIFWLIGWRLWLLWVTLRIGLQQTFGHTLLLMSCYLMWTTGWLIWIQHLLLYSPLLI